eukprot:1491379-Prymnesium_polylepis.1
MAARCSSSFSSSSSSSSSSSRRRNDDLMRVVRLANCALMASPAFICRERLRKRCVDTAMSRWWGWYGEKLRTDLCFVRPAC